MSLIAVSGCSGFVGNYLKKVVLSRGVPFFELKRSVSNGAQNYILNPMVSNGSLIHLGAVSVFNPRLHTINELMECNVESTLRLARASARYGVKRFIFLSSIKVNGDLNVLGHPFLESVDNQPSDSYGLSKYRAELGLLAIAKKTNMEVVIIRPPLVYGPSVKGNFSTILNLVKKCYPLPLASVTKNKRSLIALDNLVDFILLCADYEKTPQASSQTFVISDGEDVSTAELFQRVAKAYGKKNRLFPFPPSLLRLGAKLLGKQDMANRLLGSLQVDSSKARKLLGWKPVITMDEQLRIMAEADKYSSSN